MTDYSELSIKNTADVCRCCSSFSCSHTASSPFDLVALIHPTFLVSLIPLSDCFSISRPLCSAAFPSFPLVLSHQSCLFPCFLPSRVPHSASFLSSLVLFTSYFHQDFYTVKIKRVYFNLFLIWKLVSPVKSGEAFWSSLLLVPRSSSPQFWPPFLHHVSPFLSSSSLSAGQQTIRLVTLPQALWLHLFRSCPFPFLLQSLSSLPSVKQAEVFIINHFLDSGRNRFKCRSRKS